MRPLVDCSEHGSNTHQGEVMCVICGRVYRLPYPGQPVIVALVLPHQWGVCDCGQRFVDDLGLVTATMTVICAGCFEEVRGTKWAEVGGADSTRVRLH